MNDTQKIVTYLWFNNNAEEAVNLYTSLFANSKIVSMSRYGDAGPGPKGSVMIATFQLENQNFIALNGGPQYQFTPAISLLVNCTTQEEVDTLWEKLSEGGQKGQCGWLTDKFGLSWQIVPTIIGELMQSKNAVKTNLMMQALLKMTKLNIAELQQAYNG